MEADAVRIIEVILNSKLDVARAYIAGVRREQKPIPADDIRIIINYELGILRDLIAQNLSTDLSDCAETVDQKYNHWEAFNYVFARHYVDAGDRIPEYYQRALKYVNSITRKDTCAQVVDCIISMTDP